MRTGNGTSINGLNGLGSLDDTDLLASLYKSGLNSLFSYFETPTDTFPTMTSSTGSSGAFSSSGSCSSSSSSSGGRGDLGAIWSSSDEGLGDSPSFENTTALSNIWSYPSVAPSRPSPANSTSPADSLLSSAKCLVCGDAKVTHALLPCGHNFFCVDCANRICDSNEPQCPVCSSPAIKAIRIYSPNP
ncbi:KH domain [Popillia japonica]